MAKKRKLFDKLMDGVEFMQEQREYYFRLSFTFHYYPLFIIIFTAFIVIIYRTPIYRIINDIKP